MSEVSADILTFPNLTQTVHEHNWPNAGHCRSVPRNDRVDRFRALSANMVDADATERVLHHLLKLNGLVG